MVLQDWLVVDIILWRDNFSSIHSASFQYTCAGTKFALVAYLDFERTKYQATQSVSHPLFSHTLMYLIIFSSGKSTLYISGLSLSGRSKIS